MVPVIVDMADQQVNELSVPLLKGVQSQSPLELISMVLDKEEKRTLRYAPWNDDSKQPQVSFAVGHTNDCVVLKYFVEEGFLIAANGAINTPVYSDSCVEFFISFDDSGYYNFEFNCIGTCLAGFGAGRAFRSFLPEERISSIKSFSVIDRNGLAGEIKWTITLIIPLPVFTFHAIPSLSGLQARANFYKCGDGLPQPHFMSWAAIEAPEPDFHLPQFFGALSFR